MYKRQPIIGIGAPVSAWLPEVAAKLNTDLVIPDHAEVANAVGAATGKIMETVKVLIKPGEKDGTYLVHAPWERKYFEDLQEAIDYALEEMCIRDSLYMLQKKPCGVREPTSMTKNPWRY